MKFKNAEIKYDKITSVEGSAEKPDKDGSSWASQAAVGGEGSFVGDGEGLSNRSRRS